MKDRLFEALKKNTADYAEIRFEIEDSTYLGYRGKEFDSVRTGRFSGGNVRACKKGGWGMAIFNSPDDLGQKVEEACRFAALVGREKTELASPEAQVDGEKPAALDRDFRGITLDEKIKLTEKYNDIVMKEHRAIETSHVFYDEIFRTVYFASSEGNYFMEERPLINLSVNATARKGSLVQRGSNGRSSAVSYDAVLGFEEKAEEAARRAVSLLEAPPCDGGTYTVVLDQELGGVFAHEAFGHLSEADFLYENPKVKELMYIGRRMGIKELNIIDDGAFDRLLGTRAYDDEGTPTRKSYLIKEGVLVGHLHSRETAGKMGARPTGNARAIGLDAPPIVRMTNTYIAARKQDFDSLIADIDDGIYACGAFGGQTAMEMFTFSARYGFRIKKGRVGEMLRDIVLTGNVFETLNNIDGFGSDLKMIEKPGGCGKKGQAPLPGNLWRTPPEDSQCGNRRQVVCIILLTDT